MSSILPFVELVTLILTSNPTGPASEPRRQREPGVPVHHTAAAAEGLRAEEQSAGLRQGELARTLEAEQLVKKCYLIIKYAILHVSYSIGSCNIRKGGKIILLKTSILTNKK